jgi:DNA-binding NtrC family response regulator
MAQKLSQPDSVNVLISNANWAWPQAVAEIFQPRGFNALVANSARDIVQLVSNHRIHLAILDMVMDDLTGIQALKIIRQQNQLLPCILLAAHPEKRLLAQALSLKAHSVLAKPVDIPLLAEQIDRLFQKRYESNNRGGAATGGSAKLTINIRIE